MRAKTIPRAHLPRGEGGFGPKTWAIPVETPPGAVDFGYVGSTTRRRRLPRPAAPRRGRASRGRSRGTRWSSKASRLFPRSAFEERSRASSFARKRRTSSAWSALNQAKRGAVIEINPVVGVRNQRVERATRSSSFLPAGEARVAEVDAARRAGANKVATSRRVSPQLPDRFRGTDRRAISPFAPLRGTDRGTISPFAPLRETDRRAISPVSRRPGATLMRAEC